MYDLAVFVGGHAVLLLLGAVLVLAARNWAPEPNRPETHPAQAGAIGTIPAAGGDASQRSENSSPAESCASPP